MLVLAEIKRNTNAKGGVAMATRSITKKKDKESSKYYKASIPIRNYLKDPDTVMRWAGLTLD